MDRITYLLTREGRAAARPSGPSLADALADREVAVVRIRQRFDARFRPYHGLTAWSRNYRRIDFDPASPAADQAQRQALIAWYLEIYPDVDWSRDHQLIIATGEIQTAPDAWETGWLPEDDRTFAGTPCLCIPAEIRGAA